MYTNKNSYKLIYCPTPHAVSCLVSCCRYRTVFLLNYCIPYVSILAFTPDDDGNYSEHCHILNSTRASSGACQTPFYKMINGLQILLFFLFCHACANMRSYHNYLHIQRMQVMVFWSRNRMCLYTLSIQKI